MNVNVFLDYFTNLTSTDQIGESLLAVRLSVFRDLLLTLDPGEQNPRLKPASGRAYSEALKWAAWAASRFVNNVAPEVAVSGDGGLVLRWVVDGDFVALHFDADLSELDAVFYDIDGRVENEDVNEELVERLISELISSRDLSSSRIVYSPRPQISSAQPDFLDSELEPTSASSYVW